MIEEEVSEDTSSDASESDSESEYEYEVKRVAPKRAAGDRAAFQRSTDDMEQLRKKIAEMELELKASKEVKPKRGRPKKEAPVEDPKPKQKGGGKKKEPPKSDPPVWKPLF